MQDESEFVLRSLNQLLLFERAKVYHMWSIADGRYCEANRSVGSIGLGVKHRAKITTASSASQRRGRSSGVSSSSVRGCRGPITTITATIRTVQTTQFDEMNA